MSNDKKKIIIIGPAYPYRGGNALFVSHTYKVLKDHFNVKVYNYKLLYPSLLFPGKTQFDESEKIVFKVPGIRVVNAISPFNWFSVAKKLKKENAHLIIFDWWHPFFGICHGVISFLIRRSYAKKILFITENVVSHEANWFDRFLTQFGLAYAYCFLVLSKKVEEELKTFSSERKIYRSELPIYDCYRNKNPEEELLVRNELGINKNNKVILFFGYIRKYKGLDILIEAFSKILFKHPDSTLLIVGEFYDKPDTYLNLIEHYNIKDHVIIVNKFVPNEEVSKYYLSSDVVILPYRSATQSGILNVAYGFNKPAIVTDVGGLSEFVEESKTGLVVKPDSAEAIATGYEKLLKLLPIVDFKQNIMQYNRANGFQNLPVLMNKIFNDIE